VRYKLAGTMRGAQGRGPDPDRQPFSDDPAAC
jgi:hypothetical protein